MTKFISNFTGTTDDPYGTVEMQRKIVLGALFVIWAVSGTVLFTSMGLGPIEIIYVMVQIVTTVGYGDLVPKTQGQKLGVAALVLGSTLLVANIIMVAIDTILDQQADMLAAEMEAKVDEIEHSKLFEQQQEAEASGAAEAGSPRAPTDVVAREVSLNTLEQRKKESAAKKNAQNLLVNGGIFLVCLILGAVFFKMWEPCLCSYGNEPIEGCKESKCEETGGLTKTWADAIYMCVITITTVGFGDYVPETPVGRAFGSVYMLFGVTATLNLLGNITDIITESQNNAARQKMTRNMFHEYDQDKDGKLSELEFVKLQLVQNGLASKEQIDSICKQFEAIAGSDKEMDIHEYMRYYLPEEAARGNNGGSRASALVA